MFFWRSKVKPRINDKFDSATRIKLARKLNAILLTESDPFKLLITALAAHIIGRGSRAENARNSFDGSRKAANINRLGELSLDIWLVQSAFNKKLLSSDSLHSLDVLSKAIDFSFEIIGDKFEVPASDKNTILDVAAKCSQITNQDPFVLAKFIAKEVYGIGDSHDFFMESAILNEYLSLMKALSESADGLLSIISDSMDRNTEKATAPESKSIPIDESDLNYPDGDGKDDNSVNVNLGNASDLVAEKVIADPTIDSSSSKLSQATVRDAIENKWYESDDFVDLADFPLEFIQAVGCKPLIIKMGETSPRETVIFVTPLPNDERFFSGKVKFGMKTGQLSTSYGDIIWALFIFENDAKETISFEVFYNPFRSLDIEQLSLLSKQKYWHFVFVTVRGDVLNVVECLNTYSLERVVDEIRTRTLIDTGDNFRFAVLEFQKEHALNLV